MLNLIAQATQPTGGFASWSVADWVIFLAAFGAMVTGIIAAWRKAGGAEKVANEAKVDAAESKGMTTAAQKSLDRFSERANTQDKVVAETLKEMPPTPKGPTE